MYFRGDTVADRIREGRCVRCGQRPAEHGTQRCDPCHAHTRANDKRSRAARIEQARKFQAEVDARRLRVCREVVVEGVTFVVMNSYDTVSANRSMARTNDSVWSGVTKVSR